MVVTRNYYVYLTETTDAETDKAQHTDWIAFICPKLDIAFTCNNVKEDLPAHKSFEIKTGEYKLAVGFKDVLITSVGTNAPGKTSYNSLINFLASHALTGGSKIYAMVYMDIGDGNPDWIEFPNASSSMVDYMQCRVKTCKVSFDATKGYAKGNIKLEEEWLS